MEAEQPSLHCIRSGRRGGSGSAAAAASTSPLSHTRNGAHCGLVLPVPCVRLFDPLQSVQLGTRGCRCYRDLPEQYVLVRLLRWPPPTLIKPLAGAVRPLEASQGFSFISLQTVSPTLPAVCNS